MLYDMPVYGTFYISFQTRSKTRRRIKRKLSICSKRMGNQCTNKISHRRTIFLLNVKKKKIHSTGFLLPIIVVEIIMGIIIMGEILLARI